METDLKKGYDELLIKEIKKYIHQEIKSGKSINEIHKSLIQAGHDRNVINDAINELKKYNFKLTNRDFNKINKNIQNEAELKLIKALEIFIKDQLKHGIKLNKIIKVLKNYGHSEKIINEALKKIEHKENPIKKNKSNKKNINLLKEHIFLTGLTIINAIVVITSVSANENLLKVILGFSPTILTIILTHILDNKLKKDKDKDKIYLVPLILTTIFYISSSTIPTIKNMEYASLSLINLILSYSYLEILKKTIDKETKK